MGFTITYQETLAEVCTEMGVGIGRGIAWDEAGLIRACERDGRYYVDTREADRMVRLGAEWFDRKMTSRPCA